MDEADEDVCHKNPCVALGAGGILSRAGLWRSTQGCAVLDRALGVRVPSADVAGKPRVMFLAAASSMHYYRDSVQTTRSLGRALQQRAGPSGMGDSVEQ